MLSSIQTSVHTVSASINNMYSESAGAGLPQLLKGRQVRVYTEYITQRHNGLLRSTVNT